MIEEAICIATKAHKGQDGQGWANHIYHPLRVMFQLKSEAERICSVLHDVIEDSNYN